jgi:type II secretory pathway component PulF
MLYRYVASDKTGKIAESQMEAEDLNQVLQYLSGRELQPISVKPLKEEQVGLRRFFGRRISMSDKVFLTKYLALMMKVGTDLLSAINILILDFDKPAVRNFLLEVRENLSRGRPFYRAFEGREDIFSPTFINMIKAAEASGNLQQTFEDLSVSLVREADLKSHIRAALIYPIILLSLTSAIVIFLVTFALPKVAKVFTDTGVQPPLFSRIVFAVGLFIGNNIIVIVSILAGVIAAVVYAYYKTVFGRRLFSRLFSSLPLIKNIYRELAVQQFTSTMSSLMKAGLPIVETIRVAADTVGFAEYKFSLERIANEGLAKGLTIGDAFKREIVFPKTVVNLIAISEKAGHLEEVLATLADFYASTVDSGIKTLVSLLEPLLLLVMGLIVATIAISIIIPIYQLTAQF